MSESSDYTPSSSYSGHDFYESRRSYETERKKQKKRVEKKKEKTCQELIEPELRSNARAGLIMINDVSGSRGDDPGVLVEKAPYLDYEIREYLGQSVDLAFLAVSDVHAADKYPFQAPAFVSGDQIPQTMRKLITTEKGGGNGINESFETAAIYACRNIHLPNADRKIIIFTADEIPYDTLEKSHARVYGKVNLSNSIPTTAVFEELKSLYSVYAILYPYGGYSRDRSVVTRTVYEHWVKLIGVDHIANLSDARRTVDVIFGILAQETDRVGYFYQELTQRQMQDSDGTEKIAKVKAALTNIHAGFDFDSGTDGNSGDTETLF